MAVPDTTQQPRPGSDGVAGDERRGRSAIAWSAPPVRPPGLVLFVAGWVGLSVLTTIIGVAVVEWWEPSNLGDADADVNRWWEARRSAWLDEIAAFGSAFSDTITIVLFAIPLVPLFLRWFRRWHEVALLVGVMVLETGIYFVTSRLVLRERPPVEQVSGPFTDHSFPSGHVAAAIVFYGALAVIVVWHAPQRWARITWMGIAFVVPAWVAWSRVYLGIHHITDFIGSLIIGAGVLVVTSRAIRTHDDDGPPDPASTDPDGHHLDTARAWPRRTRRDPGSSHRSSGSVPRLRRLSQRSLPIR